MNEDLMRGAIARLGQLAEVVAVNVAFNSLVAIMALFGVYLVTAVRTPQAYQLAPYVVAGSVAMAAKGAVLLHRKWNEYAEAELVSEGGRNAWHNPSLDVSSQSKSAVLIANIGAVVSILVPVLIYSYIQIAIDSPTALAAVVRILPSLVLTLLSAWAWARASM
jgi:hypothetical protein